ncbi:ABC transporter ATP-binding protein [Hoeflea poritis]|uniref:ATP-binding cassette domain-containing protein n=1 Tax=Hoeflea poritis TaxID=2993659 RepID=A0ABT4VQU1_9HYPH|nr:ATP-binding cassette domain-containing protein [Hoeflea poritis]MDA4846383.1 ATP-binding cassette domain-containing protein [Hoeflea poritis]
MTPFFEIRNLSKSFGGLKAVNDLSLTVEEGEIMGIAGPNGSGKSTLFNLITKIPFGPDSGSVVFRGEAIENRADKTIARMGIVRTFQREAVFASLSCVDNILVAVEQTGGLRGAEAEKRADEASDIVGFPRNFHNIPAAQLPVFYQKQLMITTAVAQQPTILLMDEPASSLVDDEVDWVHETIKRLNAMGMTILLIEHILPLLTGVSSRLLVLEQGTPIALGAVKDVIRDPAVVEAFLGKPQ